MSLSTATQVLSFENFGALEAHLRILKSRYNDMIKKYEETLGYILRDSTPTSQKNQKVQEKWTVEMQRTMASSTKAKVVKKEESKSSSLSPSKFFGNGKDKEKNERPSADWISLDPMSIFVGPKHKGMAEIYFDTINLLRENVGKINLALSICSTLKVKAATAGNTSLIVSFVNDIPTKVMLKSARDGQSKKYTMAFSFAVPSVRATY